MEHNDKLELKKMTQKVINASVCLRAQMSMQLRNVNQATGKSKSHSYTLMLIMHTKF